MVEVRKRKLTEQRESRRVDWSQVSIINIETPDSQVSPVELTEYHGERIRDFMVDIISDIAQAIVSAEEIELHPEELRRIEVIIKELELYKQLLFNPQFEPRQDLKVSLSEWLRETSADIRTQESSSSFNSYLDIGHEEGVRKYILPTSDSHRTTANVFETASLRGFEVGDNTAVMAFDNHLDLGARGRFDMTAKKHDVNTYLLQRELASKLAVIGSGDQLARSRVSWSMEKQVDVVTGREVYSAEERPDRKMMEERVRAIFQRWQTSGIEQVYPAVDLDCLRLPEQSYTGVDYTSLVHIRRLIAGCLPYSFQYQQAKKATGAERAAILTKLKDSMLQDAPKYYGINASWPLRAMEIARKEFGFQIGLHHPGTKQVIVGDVSEYHPRDFQGRTFRIAKGIMNGLLHIGQQQ